jgi:hypothetical protein
MPYSNPISTAKWGLMAPGGSGTRDTRDVISTSLNPAAPTATNLYSYGAAASVAAAHTSGVVALLLAEGFSPMQAVQRIIDTARLLACGVGCHGLLDAAAAVAPPARVVVNNVTRPSPVATAKPSSTHARTAPVPTSPSVELPSPPEVALGPTDAPIGAPPIAKVVGGGIATGGWKLLACIAFSMAGGGALLVRRRHHYSHRVP